MIKLNTNMGTITIELDFDNAPKTAANFQQYVEDGFYDGKIFHRVIDNFMVQGGGFTSGMEQKSVQDPIKNEANNMVSNERGTIAMARTNDPHSASAQFFINLKDNVFLDFKSETTQGWGYCVFGKVIEGMGVIDKIAIVDTGSYGPHQDVPKDPIIIKEIIIE